MRRISLGMVLVVALACGGKHSYTDSAAKCAAPRSGTDPYTNQPYPDRQGSSSDEKTWLRGFMGDLYLWYNEIPNVDASNYPTMDAYFQALKTPLRTPSGNLEDRFSFTYPTAQWEALSQAGVEVGYGVTWALVAQPPPATRPLVYAAFLEPSLPSSPAAGAGITRGTQVLTVDGVDVQTGAAGALNAGLFPQTAGEPHTFQIVARGAAASTATTVTMTSAAIASTPVQNAHFIPNTKVGYVLFNAHVATAEKGLVDAINLLPGATALVLDLRYNGGGYLAIASELAYMISKPARTASMTFERIAFSDKYPGFDPVLGHSVTPTPFYSQTLGFDALAPGQPLPHLDLDRVFVLTGSSTCSASEAVINGLSGVGEQVYLVGSTTCGKPYGFYPQDNCGTTYFPIEFKGVNQKGFGDYADGFVPTTGTPGGPAGCQVRDDFLHDLGDPAEARLAAALGLIGGGACPAPTFMQVPAAPSASTADVALVRSPFLENRILGLPR